ncbi:MAG: thioredoxin family protein [Armatimonadota bacterium]|nr:thioredoxin family protein [Armatimonadota bacterium]
MFSTEEFKAKAKDFVFVHIDTDKQKAVAQRFGIGGIPDLRFLTNDGTEVHKVVGFIGMALLAEFDVAKAKGGR